MRCHPARLHHAHAVLGHAQAAAEFKTALALEPGSALTYRNLGNVLASLGRTDEAVEALTRAAALDPADAAAPYDLGSVLVEAGRYEPAAEAFRAALALGIKLLLHGAARSVIDRNIQHLGAGDFNAPDGAGFRE